jgi:cytoskeleton protein RodZ
VDDGVGNRLREARAQGQISLQEAEAATKIRTRYLQAIEEEDWELLPGDVYARAFIRTYGAFLGLDGEGLAEEQRRGRGAVRPGERLQRANPRPRGVGTGRRRRRISPGLAAVAVSVLVAIALLAIGLSGGGDSNGGGGGGKGEPAGGARPHVGQAVPVR